MNLFDKVEKTFNETGQGISRKAKELVEVTRLKKYAPYLRRGDGSEIS